MKDQFRSDLQIARVTAPLLFLHGGRDWVVPIALGERLYALANEPKQFLRFSDAGHEEVDMYGAQDVVRAFLAPLSPEVPVGSSDHRRGPTFPVEPSGAPASTRCAT